MRRLAYAVAALMLAGCAGLIEPGQFEALSFLNTYEAAKSDYEKGRIMLARNRVLAMDKTREDYPMALDLLRTKIDPARLRLLRHYTRRAREEERQGQWYKAMESYAQAAELNTTPEELLKKRREMEMKMRQVRMEGLIAQRRSEDSELLKWVNDFEVPKGVDPRDESYSRMLEHMQESVELRTDQSYHEARRYLSRDLPELAYIEAETYLRFEPDSERGAKLLAEIKGQIPPELHVPAVGSSRSKSTLKRQVTVRQPSPKKVSREDIVQLMNQGNWLKAKQYVQVYRREGGDGADRLLADIHTSMKREAANAFTKGRLAFRQEHVDEAITHWERAVELEPDNSEYTSALQKAKQLQEQLRVLRETESEK